MCRPRIVAPAPGKVSLHNQGSGLSCAILSLLQCQRGYAGYLSSSGCRRVRVTKSRRRIGAGDLYDCRGAGGVAPSDRTRQSRRSSGCSPGSRRAATASEGRTHQRHLRIGELGEIESAAGERDRLGAGLGSMMWLFRTRRLAVIPQQSPSVSVTISMTPMLAETDGVVHRA
jgi:hypothetical protein